MVYGDEMFDDATLDEASVDEILDLLADRHRRHVLRYLIERDCAATVTDVAEYLVTQMDALSEEGALVRLHHVHFPKLVKAGVVTCDGENGTVSLTRKATLLSDWLTVIDESVTRSPP